MKMQRRLAILAAIAALAILAGTFLVAPSKTPPDQKPLLTLSAENLGQFVAAFDEAADAPRLLLLFSPT